MIYGCDDGEGIKEGMEVKGFQRRRRQRRGRGRRRKKEEESMSRL